MGSDTSLADHCRVVVTLATGAGPRPARVGEAHKTGGPPPGSDAGGATGRGLPGPSGATDRSGPAQRGIRAHGRPLYRRLTRRAERARVRARLPGTGPSEGRGSVRRTARLAARDPAPAAQRG